MTTPSPTKKAKLSEPLILHWYRKPCLDTKTLRLINEKQRAGKLPSFKDSTKEPLSEFCYNIEVESALTTDETTKLQWLLSETFEQDSFSTTKPFIELQVTSKGGKFGIEVGPRLSFSTAWCSNALSICKNCSLTKVLRMERSRRYSFEFVKNLTKAQKEYLQSILHDRMTEQVYSTPLESFSTSHVEMDLSKRIEIIGKSTEESKDALRQFSEEKGLGWGDWDVNFLYELYVLKEKRNPTDVELFDLAQSNSEHSRHW